VKTTCPVCGTIFSLTETVLQDEIRCPGCGSNVKLAPPDIDEIAEDELFFLGAMGMFDELLG